MDWQDNGLIIKATRHGEGKAIVTVFTEHHGRHMGCVRATSKLSAVLQPGSLVDCKWRARLQDQLGFWTFEAQQSFYSRVLHSSINLAALMSACSLIDITLAEREEHSWLYNVFKTCLGQLDQEKDGLANYVKFELSLLKELGFGLDLVKCALTGEMETLSYVSPRTGRAVTYDAGEPYKDRLLSLPSFLVENCQKVPIKDIIGGLELTGYFIERFALSQFNKAMPAARQRLLELLKRHAERTADISRCATG